MPNDRQKLWKIPYTAPLLGNIRQILTGLQGFDSMAREIIQNADDAGARKIRFSIKPECLRVWNDGLFESCGLPAHSIAILIADRLRRRTYQRALDHFTLPHGHSWNSVDDRADGCVIDGEVASIRTLARELDLDHRHVTRALPLAFLAPEIVGAILDGRQPVELTARKLERMDALPIR